MSVKEATVGDALQRAWNEMCQKGYQATVGKEISFTYQNNPVNIFRFRPDSVFFTIEKTRAYDTDWTSKDFPRFRFGWEDPIKHITVTFDKWSDEEIIARTAKVYFTINRPIKDQKKLEHRDWLEGQILIKEDSIWPFEYKRNQLLENQN